jgi:hypothetical protein
LMLFFVNNTTIFFSHSKCLPKFNPTKKNDKLCTWNFFPAFLPIVFYLKNSSYSQSRRQIIYISDILIWKETKSRICVCFVVVCCFGTFSIPYWGF